MDQVVSLVGRLKAFEQKKWLNAVISYIAKQFFQSELVSKEDEPISHSPVVSGAACLLSRFIQHNEILKDYIVASLTRATISSLDDSISTRRAVVAALAQDEGE